MRICLTLLFSLCRFSEVFYQKFLKILSFSCQLRDLHQVELDSPELYCFMLLYHALCVVTCILDNLK